MGTVELTLAGVVLIVAVGLGTVVHELSHALMLHIFGVPCRIEWLPDRDGRGVVEASVTGRPAVVTPRLIPPDFPAWQLRIAALAPLLLATPLVVGLAVGPAEGGAVYTGALIGWLACALPSPQDFSLFWYADRAIAEFSTTDGAGRDDARWAVDIE